MNNLLRPRLMAVFFCLSLLTACAGVSRVPLNKDASAKITSVDSKIMIPADEIIVRAKPSNISGALGGGLIPALIDASVTKSRQTALEVIANPFYEKTDAIDFRALFTETFKTSIGNQQLLPNLSVSVSSRGFSNTAKDEKLAELKPGKAFLGIRVWYEFTPDMRSVIVIANTLMLAGGTTEPVYTNSFLYTSNPIEGDPLVAWSENQGKALAEAFAESAKQVAYMLKQDLEAPSNEIIAANNAKQAKVKATIPFYGPFLRAPNGSLVPLSTDGFLVEESDHRKIVRAEGGAIYSVPK